jgi:RHS repeat-associated protein
MKSPRNALIIILFCILYIVYPISVFACAWYAGADGIANTGAVAGKNPKNPGCCDTCAGDPVDVATGRCTYTVTDLSVTSPGIPVAFSRTFNNLDLKVSSLGWGWRFSFDMRVIFTSNASADITNAIIINANGKRDIYTKGTGNVFNPPSGIYNSLALNADNTSTLSTQENLTYTFNQGGRLKEIKDLNGNTLTINYTDNSPTAEITTVVDSVGRTYIFTYLNGKIKTIKDPALRTVTYTYNGNLLTHVTNPVNETIEYGYDPSTNNLLTIKNPAGVIYLTNTYDAQGRVTTQSHAGKLYEFTYWDGATEVKEQGLYASTYYYNTTYGFVTQYIDPFNKWTTYTWDIATKQLMSVIDPLSNVTNYTYYPNGKTWTITQTISATESKTTTFTYNSYNKLLTITDPENNVTTFTYTTDGKANLYSIEDYLGNTTYFEDYNSSGQFRRIKDANLKYTYITYDQYGYLESIKDPLNRITYFTHDIVGNRTQVKDALTRTTDYFYENFTRLDYIRDALGHITNIDYDLNGNIKKVTDARLYDTHFEYNEINQLRYVKDHFLNTKTTYTYDSRHNLEQVTNASGRKIVYTYDALNKVKTKTLYKENGVDVDDAVNYTYDASGRLTNINNTSANLTLGYDKAHRLTSATTGGGMPGTTISYEYYKNDIRKIMTDAGGVSNYSLRTAINPLETITFPNTGTFTISYDNLNRRNTMTMGNGIAATYTYDDASQLTNLEFKNGAISVTFNQYPLYDLVGNRKTEIDGSGTHGYDYDALYRLTSATHPAGNPNEFFNYIDPVGSVGNRTSSHLSNLYTVNELNRLLEDDSFIYGYDADGNMTSKQNKTTNEITYFYYDAENKLVQVDRYNSTPTLISSVSYAYDGFGRRVKKNVNGTVTYYVYDMEDIRFETDGTGAITAEYTHGPGIDEPLAMKRSGNVYYYHTNGLGSVTALTDSSKAVVQSYVYDAFGQIISQTGSITNPYTFTGREYDSETGLYYYRARYYDAKIGRFISEDPIGFEGGDVNLMAYVGNNPVNYTDPLGLWAVKLNFYWGYGGYISFGREGSKNFVRAGGGVGAGGGIRFYPTGKFPANSECGPAGFIGASGSIGVAVGPISGEIKGETGGLITRGPDGKPQVKYIEQGGVQGSIKGTTGWGLSVGGGLNIVDIGISW